MLRGNLIIWSNYRWNIENGFNFRNNIEFNILNEEIQEFISRWSQSFLNVTIPSYLKQKTFDYCL